MPRTVLLARLGGAIAVIASVALFLRVAERPGGCSGLSYEMYFDSERADDDIEHDYGEVKVVVDPASSAYLTGASLDYKDGLQSGFTISNPNAQRT